MTLPLPIIGVLVEFRFAFTEPTWKKIVVLFVGAVLARGRRTVASLLRAAGHGDDPRFRAYHDVFRRAVWSARNLSRCLLQLLISRFVTDGELVLVIDETLERRWGPQIRKRSHHRDPVRSSKTQFVATPGLRWMVLAIVVTVPWCRRAWALPFFSRIATSKKTDQKQGRRHKTLCEHARQMIRQVRRWVPQIPITILGDTTYAAIALGTACHKAGARLIAPLPWNARLFSPPQQTVPRRRGRPRLVGTRLPTPRQIRDEPATRWSKSTVHGPDDKPHELELASDTALWYHSGESPLKIRWVIVRDPSGEWETRVYFSTCPDDAPATIIERFLKRWTIETTFEESRAHLGIETQRQWSDLAIERETPCLLGLYSVVTLIGAELTKEGQVLVQQTSWYAKAEASFADILAATRSCLWAEAAVIFGGSTQPTDPQEIQRTVWKRLVENACYSH
jgi:hypothetical protein